MSTVYIGIGSNIGNKKENFEKAIDSLHNDENIEVITVSSFYLTKPVGGPPQEDFLNGIIKIETSLDPKELFEKAKQIEIDLGRKKTLLNGPRIIDLDILIFGDKVVENEDLIIPHPRMHERLFVLKGLFEIEPELVHPVKKKTIRDLLTSIENNDANN